MASRVTEAPRASLPFAEEQENIHILAELGNGELAEWAEGQTLRELRETLVLAEQVESEHHRRAMRSNGLRRQLRQLLRDLGSTDDVEAMPADPGPSVARLASPGPHTGYMP